MSFDNFEQNKLSSMLLHYKHLFRSAKPFGVERAQLHVEQGIPDDVIPKSAKIVNADLVVVGSGEHKGFIHNLMRHTLDYIIEKINCDLLVLKPETVH